MENNKFILPSSTSMGNVTLNVRDLDRALTFYVNGVGLEILEQTETKVVISNKKTKIITLIKSEKLDYTEENSAGLYHVAILFEDKNMLAKSLLSMFQKYPGNFEGSGDHLVSQAFYFHDPEGNGLELYYDRPRSEWKWSNGQIEMAALYIDPAEFIKKNLTNKNTELKANVGHVHLKIGDIGKAKEFYVDILGFEITTELPQPVPSALFVSAGGYHHHLGLNIWESKNAGTRKETLGLQSFEIVIQDSSVIDELKTRLKEFNIDYKEENGTLFIKDPWNNGILIK